jgi:hypothetical protein
MTMDDEVLRNYRRWVELDEAGNEEDADGICRSMFTAVDADPLVPLDFASRTMEAIAADTERHAVRVKQMRRALTVAGVLAAAAAVYFGSGLAVSAASSLLTRTFDLLIAVIVNSASGIQAGAGIWGVFGSIGRATSAFVSDPKITVVLLVLQGLAIGALITLQRLLGSDGESFK